MNILKRDFCDILKLEQASIYFTKIAICILTLR